MAARARDEASDSMRAATRLGILAGLLALATCVMGGCTSQLLRAGQSALRDGRLETARRKLETYASRNRDTKNTVIAHLELGHLKHLTRHPTESNDAFAVAERRIEWMDRQPAFRISREGTAALTNLNALPYRARNYDRIMMSTYRALNYLQLRRIDAARVELRKVHAWQELAVHRNAERIEQAREAAQETVRQRRRNNQAVYDMERARRSDQLQKTIEANYAHLDQFEPYAKYVNPFAEWLRGIYYLSVPAEPADIDRGKKALERAYGMESDNPYLSEDLALAERRQEGADFPPVTYVIFFTGDAPRRAEMRIDIPLFIFDAGIDYVGVNFPRLVRDESFTRYLRVHGDEGTHDTAVLADMDSIISHEFKQNLPVTVTRTLISAGTKAAVAYGLNEATRGHELANLITRIGTTAYQYGMNQADLRSWTTLPKQIQYARLPTPSSGRLTLTTASGPSATARVEPGRANVVLVKSYAPGKRLDVFPFLLERHGDEEAVATADRAGR